MCKWSEMGNREGRRQVRPRCGERAYGNIAGTRSSWGLAARDVYALTRVPVSTGPVAAAVDHVLNGLDAEPVVVPGLVAGKRRRGIPYEDSVGSCSEDVVALDHGAFDR